MRVFACAVGLGLGALASGPSLALTVQTAPPAPDVAQHLHSTSASAAHGLPGPDQLKDSFAASGRAQLGQGFYSSGSSGTSTFSFGSVRATTTVAPGYGAFWNGASRRDSGNPLSLTPTRP